VVSARSATLGAVSTGGQELLRLIRQGRLEWRGELSAAQLSQMTAGQRIALSLPDGRTATARVRQTAPSLDARTRLGLVYADVDSSGPARAGMYATGRVVLGQSTALVVPAASVVIRDGRSYVFATQAQGGSTKVVSRPVTIGRRQGADVEIVQGLAAGDSVCVQGAGFLADGDVVRVASPEAVRVTPVPMAVSAGVNVMARAER
jgi:RND family efflux transporter MFP subunit